jgi:hypothetical protein
MPEGVFCAGCRQVRDASPCTTCRRTAHAQRNSSSPYQDPRWRAFARAHTRGRTCAACGSRRRLTLHHVDGRQANITAGPFIVLCGRCHSQYEADLRRGLDTEHRRGVEAHAARARGTHESAPAP